MGSSLSMLHGRPSLVGKQLHESRVVVGLRAAEVVVQVGNMQGQVVGRLQPVQ